MISVIPHRDQLQRSIAVHAASDGVLRLARQNDSTISGHWIARASRGCRSLFNAVDVDQTGLVHGDELAMLVLKASTGLAQQPSEAHAGVAQYRETRPDGLLQGCR